MALKTSFVKLRVSPEEKLWVKHTAKFFKTGMSNFIRMYGINPTIVELEYCEFFKEGNCVKDGSIGICKYIQCWKKDLLDVD